MLKDFIYTITQEFNRAQPWLDEVEAFTPQKKDAGWNNPTMKRRQYKGNGVRNAGISDIAKLCPRKMLHSMYGVSSFKLESGDGTFQNRYGVSLNTEIDRIFKDIPQVVVGNECPKKEDGSTGFPFGSSWVNSPRPFKKIDGVERKGFWGCWDFFLNDTREIIELKALPGELPDKPYDSHIRQTSLYVRNHYGAKGGWVLYLPADLSTLDAEDPTTFRAFYIRREEAIQTAKDVDRWVDRATELLTEENINHGSPVWFYNKIRNIKPCEEEFCCGKSIAFHSKYRVVQDWSFVPR